jgi:anti-anti-sigma factor
MRLTGEFDLQTRDALKRRLDSLRNAKCQAVVLDLSSTVFVDSTVIGVLMAAHRDGLDFTIRGACGFVRRTLELLAVPKVFPFED